MATQVPFRPDELEELAKANAIRQGIKAQRRKRQVQHDEIERKRAEAERFAAEARAFLAREDKLDFDARIRRVLVNFTLAMDSEGIGVVAQPAKDSPITNRFPVFSISDNRNGQDSTLIYWVYGKGFEWE